MKNKSITIKLKKFFYAGFYIFVIFKSIFLVSQINAKSLKVMRTQYLMGTLCTIEVKSHLTKDKTNQIISQSFNLITNLENKMSTFLKESEISKLNQRNFKNNFQLSSDLFNIIKQSLYYSHISSGTFDITIYPLLKLWRNSNKIPTNKLVQKTKKITGYKHLKLNYKNKSISFKNNFVTLDLGGIAKGYALDKVITFLKQKDIKSAFINFGGQVYVYNTTNNLKKIFIANPLNREEKILEIYLNKFSVSTSANTEKFLKKGGEKIGHIINPLTGYPVNWQGLVTVISPSATGADALSTALFVKGIKNGLKLANSLNLCVIFISPNKYHKKFNFYYSQECKKFKIRRLNNEKNKFSFSNNFIDF